MSYQYQVPSLKWPGQDWSSSTCIYHQCSSVLAASPLAMTSGFVLNIWDQYVIWPMCNCFWSSKILTILMNVLSISVSVSLEANLSLWHLTLSYDSWILLPFCFGFFYSLCHSLFLLYNKHFVHICIHTHTYTHTHIYAHLYIYLYSCTYIYIYIYTHTHTHTFTCINRVQKKN